MDLLKLFIKGSSTMLQLLQMTERWTECQTDTIYSDFEKAFDKVPHKRLISKLHMYKLSDSFTNWMCNFFKARRYRVKVHVNVSYSKWHEVTSVIPQESVLGPLLFFLFTLMT